MNEEHIKNLIKKYNEGLTSKKEEGIFMNSHVEVDEPLEKIKSFIKTQKIEIPTNLNEKLWKDFDKKISHKKLLPIFKWSAVASILLIVGFYINKNYQNEKEIQKQALLEEARMMFQEENDTELMDKILFEDETLIVYTASK